MKGGVELGRGTEERVGGNGRERRIGCGGVWVGGDCRLFDLCRGRWMRGVEELVYKRWR
jgi:hypothetical protein